MKYKILIADDSPDVCMLLEYVLRDYDVHTTHDGQEALTWLQQGNMPHVIVADIMMPELSGTELLQNVRASMYFRDIPVIVLSGMEKSEERIKCLELGADDYLVKPFNPKELKIRVANLIKRRNYARA